MPTIRGRLVLREHAPGGSLSIGEGVVINSTHEMSFGARTETSFWLLAEGAKIVIGDRVHMSNVAISARQEIVLEEDAWLGTGAQIVDTDFHALDFADRAANRSIPSAPVRVGPRAFVGMSAIILKGVTIGADAVIGAGAVVATDVPEGEIWAGNPARFLRKV